MYVELRQVEIAERHIVATLFLRNPTGKALNLPFSGGAINLDDNYYLWGQITEGETFFPPNAQREVSIRYESKDKTIRQEFERLISLDLAFEDLTRRRCWIELIKTDRSIRVLNE